MCAESDFTFLQYGSDFNGMSDEFLRDDEDGYDSSEGEYGRGGDMRRGRGRGGGRRGRGSGGGVVPKMNPADMYGCPPWAPRDGVRP